MFICAICGLTYDKKEYELMNLDYCSHKCLIEARKKLNELKDKKENRSDRINSFNWGVEAY